MRRFKTAKDSTYGYLMYNYEYNARTRKLEFGLSFLEFKRICKKNCYFCNVKPKKYSMYLNANGTINSRAKKIKKETLEQSWVLFNGIDRLNNKLGYTLDNVVSCCYICNSMKSSLDIIIFLKQIKKINDNKLLLKYNK